MEDLLTAICKNVLKKNLPELEVLGVDPKRLKKVTPPFPRITYKEALKKLADVGLEVKYGNDLGQTEEREIGKLFDKPVLITHYPRDIMAFYKKVDPEDSEVCLNANLIVPEIGEIIDGSERESDMQKILESLEHEGLDKEDYEFYLDTRRYGSVPHSGFGMGIARVVMWICDLDTIKDAIAFPRTMTRLQP
jgi:asparaginyl-tRNA synthetase